MRTKEVTYTGWGRASHATSQIARPERRRHLEALVTENPAPVLGQLRSYGDLCLNDAGQAIDLSRMDRITAFDRDAGTITVDAGVRIGDLATLLAPQGWLPAVMPGTGFATVGGAVDEARCGEDPRRRCAREHRLHAEVSGEGEIGLNRHFEAWRDVLGRCLAGDGESGQDCCRFHHAP